MDFLVHASTCWLCCCMASFRFGDSAGWPLLAPGRGLAGAGGFRQENWQTRMANKRARTHTHTHFCLSRKKGERKISGPHSSARKLLYNSPSLSLSLSLCCNNLLLAWANQPLGLLKTKHSPRLHSDQFVWFLFHLVHISQLNGLQRRRREQRRRGDTSVAHWADGRTE